MNAIRSSLAPIIPKVMRDAMLDAILTRPALALAGALSVALIKDPNFAPSGDTTYAQCDAVKADFSGYAAAVPAAFDPTNTVSPGGRAITATMDFIATTATPFVPNDIYGYYVYSGTTLVSVEKWPADFVAHVAAVGDYLSLTVEIPLDMTQSA